MLVLSRKLNDSILIGDGIEIVVTKIRGGQVWLGIRAPAETRIRRGELHPRLAGEEDEIPTPDPTGA